MKEADEELSRAITIELIKEYIVKEGFYSGALNLDTGVGRQKLSDMVAECVKAARLIVRTLVKELS